MANGYETDFARYATNLRVAASAVAALFIRIQHAAPKTLRPLEVEALADLERAAQQVQEARAERRRKGPRVAAPRGACANAWLALYESVFAMARLRLVTKRGDEAQALIERLFTSGVPFATADADKMWDGASELLAQIREERLGELIQTVTGGTEHLTQAKRTTAALGEAIGVGQTPVAKPAKTSVQDALSEFGAYVGAWGRALSAGVKPSDAVGIKRLVDAMAPVEEYRASTRGGTVIEEDDEEDDGEQPASPTPTPVVPAGPTEPERDES